MARHYKEIVGVLIREDLESNILYTEYVYEFVVPGQERGVYVATNYGFSCYTSFHDLVRRMEDLWAPVLGSCYKDLYKHNRQVYLSFQKTKHPKQLGLIGDWKAYAER